MMPRSAHAVCNPVRCIVNRPSYENASCPTRRRTAAPVPTRPGPKETDPNPEFLVVSGPERLLHGPSAGQLNES